MSTNIAKNTSITNMIGNLKSTEIDQDDDNRVMVLTGTYKGGDVEGTLYDNATLKLKITVGNFVLTTSSDHNSGVFYLEMDAVPENYPYTTDFFWDQDMEITTDGKFITQMSATSQKFDSDNIADVTQWLVDAQRAMDKATTIARDFIAA